IVGMYRPEEVSLGRAGERHPLEKVLAELKRYYGDVWIDLEQADGRRFIDALLDIRPNGLKKPFREALFQHTRGYALFTVELLQDMEERGDLYEDERGDWVAEESLDWETLPARAEGVIEERIGRLGEELTDILTIASVQGVDFTVQVIARIEEVRERKLLRKLSGELEKRHRLVREQGEVQIGRQVLSQYQFGQKLLQQYLYNELSAGERRLLHSDIAEALEEFYEGSTARIAVQLAWHYTQARDEEKAIPYLLLVGDKARQLYAYREAIAAYQKALEFQSDLGDYEQ
ncbi:MAG: hypothetical protein GY854_18675, partial [Deltaproteobacteria bacterium]|nr:hypothetical protein [Deltaproteobacteria bacterium]